MKWFKHDTDASIDAKLQELLLDYGAVGYGIYWYCLELIAKDVTPKNITFELEQDARIIARNLNLTIQETTNIMKKMVELELFDFSNDKLRCIKMAYRLDDFTRKGLNADTIVSNFKNSQNKVRLSPIKSDKVHLDKIRLDKIRLDKIRLDKIRLEEIRKEEDKNTLEQDFKIFWKAYPKKRSKKSGLKAFEKHYKDLPPIKELILIIKNHKKTEDWQKQDGKFIPYPATWLNAGGWQDELETTNSNVWQDDEVIDTEVTS